MEEVVIKNDKIFAALSDSNRRKIVELLHKENTTLLELAEFFPFSFQALSKHIRILEEAEIIIKEKRGKYRILSLNRKALSETLMWMSAYFDLWSTSFDRLQELITKQAKGDQP